MKLLISAISDIVLCKFRCHLQCLAAPCCCDLDALSLSDWESDLSQDQPPLSRGPGPRPGDAGRPGSCQFRPVDCQWEQCPAPQVPHGHMLVALQWCAAEGHVILYLPLLNHESIDSRIVQC